MRHIDSLINVNGNQLYVQLIETNEEQPTLVFLNDSLGCVMLWRSFPYQLAEATKCNLLIYDRQGYGRSAPFHTIKRTNSYLEEEADTLFHLLMQMQISKPILFGHSDGGSIALIAAAKYAHIIKAIVSEAAHVFVEQETLDGITVAVNKYRNTNLKARLSKYHGDKTDDVFHAWTDTWLSKEFSKWNIDHFLPRIVCPTLIIQGVNDEFGTIKQVEAIANHVKGMTSTFILPGICHTPHKEAPSETVTCATEFIQMLIISKNI
jgi:pimeloyl-ACP methyl ester carboxylesterase